jgi:hypothetical protein
MSDFALAARRLWKERSLSATVVATLALGIGSTVLMLSIVNVVLLQPLPFPGAGQLVSVGETSPGWSDNPVAGYTYRVWREHSQSFESLAVMHRTERDPRCAGRVDRHDRASDHADGADLRRHRLRDGRDSERCRVSPHARTSL